MQATPKMQAAIDKAIEAFAPKDEVEIHKFVFSTVVENCENELDFFVFLKKYVDQAVSV